MRRSRKETAETRERIISTASGLFLDKGLAEVGMRDIMATADLTPGGFYRHFESKQQLIAEATSMAFDRLSAMFDRQIAGKSPAEAIDTIVSLYLSQSQHEGNTYLCPLPMLGAELSHYGAEVRATAIRGHQHLVHLIADRLTHLPKPRALTVASGVVSTLVGAVTLAGIASDHATATTILNDAKTAIRETLFPKNKTGRVRGSKATPKAPPSIHRYN